MSSSTTTNSYISTPGEILQEEFLEPLGISRHRLAKAIGKPQSAISFEMAWLLGKTLGTSTEFWMSLQSTYWIKTLDVSDMPEVTALV